MTVESVLKNAKLAPIMGEFLNEENSNTIKLNSDNMSAAVAFRTSVEAAVHYMNNFRKKFKLDYVIGGYLEDRADLYARSNHFGNFTSGIRSMHLGVDIWAKEGHPIHAPLPGHVHSYANNDGFGNYGPTIVLEHKIEDLKFYSLYGHLSLTDLKQWEEGAYIEAGELIGHLGNPKENVGWPAHLHLQLINDMLDYHGDFPGVCMRGDLDDFIKLCPDPNLIIS